MIYLRGLIHNLFTILLLTFYSGCGIMFLQSKTKTTKTRLTEMEKIKVPTGLTGKMSGMTVITTAMTNNPNCEKFRELLK